MAIFRQHDGDVRRSERPTGDGSPPVGDERMQEAQGYNFSPLKITTPQIVALSSISMIGSGRAGLSARR